MPFFCLMFNSLCVLIDKKDFHGKNSEIVIKKDFAKLAYVVAKIAVICDLIFMGLVVQ
jgi:hypothetical protein